MSIRQSLHKHIREIPNFPKPGISFKDITPILQNPQLSQQVLDALIEHANELQLDAVVGVDSRGFLFGPSLARALDIPFVMVRKKGKLPGKTITQSYALEYGEATLEVHTDALQSGDRVLIHDDLLATGGTAKASAKLIQNLGGEVAGFAFLVNLAFLNGAQLLKPFASSCFSLIEY